MRRGGKGREGKYIHLFFRFISCHCICFSLTDRKGCCASVGRECERKGESERNEKIYSKWNVMERRSEREYGRVEVVSPGVVFNLP